MFWHFLFVAPPNEGPNVGLLALEGGHWSPAQSYVLVPDRSDWVPTSILGLCLGSDRIGPAFSENVALKQFQSNSLSCSHPLNDVWVCLCVKADYCTAGAKRRSFTRCAEHHTCVTRVK